MFCELFTDFAEHVDRTESWLGPTNETFYDRLQQTDTEVDVVNDESVNQCGDVVII